ncbi:hypothetical protein [Tenacibaculum xiamenense]|uniref:hypothetical protein n=1 Tax=Tenacibaculum xiamenense TaxID=1261553 RepID=UPI003892F0B4
MSKKPIKSNLFRFVTLRGPQTIEEKNLEIGFIKFPEGQSSSNKALTAVETVTTEQGREQALLNAYSSNFKPLDTRLQVKKEYTSIYEFSMWLARNKSALTYKDIHDNFPYTKQLDGLVEKIAYKGQVFKDPEHDLWNQLFYNTINKKSIEARDLLIHLLIGLGFIKEFIDFQPSILPKDGSPIFTDEEKKEFERRANASVVIPKEVVLSAKGENTDNIRLSKIASDYLTKVSKTDKASERSKQYKLALKELEKNQEIYQKTEKLRYDQALENHNIAVEDIKNAAVPTVEVIRDAKTGFQRVSKTYPNLELPKFTFTKNPEILRVVGTNATSQFSEETNVILNSSEFEVYTSFNEISRKLKQEIKKENEIILNHSLNDQKELNINGERFGFNVQSQMPLYSYSGDVFGEFGKGSKITLFLKVDDIENVEATEVSYVLNAFKEQKSYPGTTFESSRKTGSLLKIVLFPEYLPSLTAGHYKLSCTIKLSNGVDLELNSRQFLVEQIFGRYDAIGEFVGKCKILSQPSDEVSSDGIVYGVSQLGIADFRRVEQEVCCYVPGEVSHIENVMAREYKERSTRNLTSQEQTTEQSSETEVENLTDTSSTERNEMQREVSSIMNKDSATNFGANAGVSGKIWDQEYYANASFSSSNSSSVSNSNLQAQNYAQEVTERALERVVQKISSKRTSRMLREFEENNTHGFDNRKGDKHITGVYRWVDKIYKNKLVNYGKRLMYEFSLPEPAKFFIDSYLNTKLDTNNSELIAPSKPVHPKEEGLTSAAILSEYNYQKFSSKYNAEVKAYPSDVSVGKGFSFTTPEHSGNEFDEVSAGAEEIVIPEGYKGTWYEVAISQSDERDDGRGIQVLLGGKTCAVGYPQQIAGEHTGKITASYSVMGRHSGSVSIRIWCEVTKKASEDWQNETYKAIMDAYNQRLQEYNEFIQAREIESGGSDEKKKEFASQLNRTIEKRELKRLAVDLLAKPFGALTRKSHYNDGNNSDVVRNSGLNEHSATVKFFEQAFDWEIMAYTFYPYFYGKKDSWADSFDYIEGNDPVFKAFLQSAMARAVVPVRPGFEDAVNWYMKTGEIWNGQGMVTDMDSELYLSVADEMQTVEGEIEGTWETRVPTSLTVLQADSVALNEGGLPCNPDCEGNGLFDTVKTSPDGVDFDIVGQTNTIA